MNEQLGISLIFILAFSGGAIYHFIIRKRCTYPVKLTKPRAILLIIISPVFLAMAYYLGKNSVFKYLLAISASLFVISGAIGQGISERGIYYRPLGSAGQIIRLAKWEDIKNVKIDINKSKLEKFTYKSDSIYPDQYYDSKYINKINKYIQQKQNNKTKKD